MSVVDVGDQVEVAFTSAADATVSVTWIDPAGTPVTADTPVPESPTEPGRYVVTLLPTVAGVWEARFRATGAATAVERYFVRARSIDGPPPLATVGEVGELYGTMTPAQETLTAALLRRASEMLRGQFPDLAARVASGQLSADAPAMAVINMVLRVLRNPDGLRAETTGPFSRTYDTTVAAGLLVVSDSELALMTPGTAEAGALPVSVVIGRPGLASNTWGDSIEYQKGLRHGPWW
ncbi:hypothetical protein ACIBTV_27260 [Micromonospora sp. NPDC049366]|uniref:hypothetical protein n=1 Tax=Micromonospora sp. NPDC049366 TaxID=3364271 RepID=UPI0037957AEA